AAPVPEVPQRGTGHPRAAAGLDARLPPLVQVPRAAAGEERPGHGHRFYPAGPDDGPRGAYRKSRWRAARRRLVGGTRSRIGRKPVVVPKGVTVTLQGHSVAVKGPRGELRRSLHPDMQIAL